MARRVVRRFAGGVLVNEHDAAFSFFQKKFFTFGQVKR